MERMRSLILAKAESEYGTDATPAAATEAIITKGQPTFELVGEAKAREIPLNHFGSVAPVNVGTALKASFTTELKGSGSAGVASRYSPLFKACNMTEAIVSETSVSYTPNSVLDSDSATLYFHAGGTKHLLVGCVGTFSLTLTPSEIVTIEWEFTGLYAGTHASTVTYPTPTHEAVKPIIWKDANFIMNSVEDLVVTELSLDIGNNVIARTDGNSVNNGIGRYVISNRNSSGSVTLEKEPLTTLNPWTLWDGSTQFNLETKPTLTAGNIFEIAVTGATLEVPSYGDRENIMTWSLPFTINPTLSTGNNEIVITFK